MVADETPSRTTCEMASLPMGSPLRTYRWTRARRIRSLRSESRSTWAEGSARLGSFGLDCLVHTTETAPSDVRPISSLSDRVLALWYRPDSRVSDVAPSAGQLEDQRVRKEHAVVGEGQAAGAARGEPLGHEFVGARRAGDPLLRNALRHAQAEQQPLEPALLV